MRWLLNFFRDSLGIPPPTSQSSPEPVAVRPALHVTCLEERRVLDAAVTVDTGDGVAATEGGTTDTYTLVLNEAPTGTVTITVTPDVQTDLGAGAGVAITKEFTTQTGARHRQ